MLSLIRLILKKKKNVIEKLLKTLLFPFLGVYSGPAENSVVLSVSLFAALQVPHVPHVQGRGETFYTCMPAVLVCVEFNELFSV